MTRGRQKCRVSGRVCCVLALSHAAVPTRTNNRHDSSLTCTARCSPLLLHTTCSCPADGADTGHDSSHSGAQKGPRVKAVSGVACAVVGCSSDGTLLLTDQLNTLRSCASSSLSLGLPWFQLWWCTCSLTPACNRTGVCKACSTSGASCCHTCGETTSRAMPSLSTSWASRTHTQSR